MDSIEQALEASVNAHPYLVRTRLYQARQGGDWAVAWLQQRDDESHPFVLMEARYLTSKGTVATYIDGQSRDLQDGMRDFAHHCAYHILKEGEGEV